MTAMAHLKFLLLLLWVGVTETTILNLHKRIFNGDKCKKTEYLYHVKINGTNGTHVSRCGGSLVNKEWVLTAAHCWEGEPTWTMSAYVGIHPGPGRMVTIMDHKIYGYTGAKHDIMLLKISPPENIIQPVQLPEKVDCDNPPNMEDEITIAGLGGYQVDPKNQLSTLDDEPPHLMCANMKVVLCGRTKPCDSSLLWPNRDLICHQKDQVDTCPGDSGGGVIHRKKIYGVHVGGDKCLCGRSAISMKVCSYMNWIKQIIKPNNGK